MGIVMALSRTFAASEYLEVVNRTQALRVLHHEVGRRNGQHECTNESGNSRQLDDSNGPRYA